MTRGKFLTCLLAAATAPAWRAIPDADLFEAAVEKIMSRADLLFVISYQSSGQMIRKASRAGCTVALNFEYSELGEEFRAICEAKDRAALIAFSNRPEFADE